MPARIPMDYQIYSLLAPYICVLLGILLVVLSRKRNLTAAGELFWFIACAEGYVVLNYLELIVGSETWTPIIAQLENIVVALIPVTWLRFVFEFIERHEWKRLRLFWPFLIPPFLTTALMLTNPLHHLYWSETRFVHIDGYLAFQVNHGILYLFPMLLNYAMLLVGVALIANEYVRGRSIYRRQFYWIASGIAFGIAFNVVYVFHLIPGVRKDLTSIGFALGSVTYFIGIYRYRFLELTPAPRSRLFDALGEGIVVINGRKKIIDMNNTAMSILGLTDNDIGELIYRTKLLAPVFDKLSDGACTMVDVTAGSGADANHYEVRITPLTQRGAGKDSAVIVLHDVTERVQLYAEIKTLRGIVPICARCKKIRDDAGYWRSVESYVTERSYAEFSHGLCPECLHEMYPDMPDDSE